MLIYSISDTLVWLCQLGFGIAYWALKPSIVKWIDDYYAGRGENDANVNLKITNLGFVLIGVFGVSTLAHIAQVLYVRG